MAFIPISTFLEFFLTLIGIYFLSTEVVSSNVERVVVFQQRLIATFMFLGTLSLFLLPQYSIEDGITIVSVGLPTDILSIIAIVYSILPLIAISKLFVVLHDMIINVQKRRI